MTVTRVLRASALSLAVALAGCAHAPPTIYHWEAFEPQLYEHFKGETPPTGQLQILEAQAEKARAIGRPLPPGFRAHLAMIYLRLGRPDEAKSMFEAEKASFPEATPYMDFLLKRMTAPKKS